jgi:hypothetical protein
MKNKVIDIQVLVDLRKKFPNDQDFGNKVATLVKKLNRTKDE